LLEAGGKSAQTEAINANLQASDLWAFFQAKMARVTTIRTAAETAKLSLLGDLPTETKAAIQKQIDAWNATAERYDTEPQTGEGRKELSERATEVTAERDRKLAAYHLFELGSAASQLAIVLASAAIITGLALLVYLASALGIVGAGLGLIAWLAPTMLHLWCVANLRAAVRDIGLRTSMLTLSNAYAEQCLLYRVKWTICYPSSEHERTFQPMGVCNPFAICRQPPQQKRPFSRLGGLFRF
jgi:hypothetical protein